MYRRRRSAGAEEIGTLRFGWLAKVAGRGWELPELHATPVRLLSEPETCRYSLSTAVLMVWSVMRAIEEVCVAAELFAVRK
jgi:hypothetical protein